MLKTIRAKASAAKSKAGGTAAVRHQQPYSGRDEKPGCGRGDAAQNVPQDMQVSIFKI